MAKRLANADAGYSGTPLPQKLGIRSGHRIALIDAPRQIPAGLDSLEPSVGVRHDLRSGELDVIVLFVVDHQSLRRRLGEAARRLQPNGGLWVAWPKKASRVPTDVTEDRVREVALAAGLVDNKVCAIDETWSGLRCVYRVADRPGRRG